MRRTKTYFKQVIVRREYGKKLPTKQRQRKKINK